MCPVCLRSLSHALARSPVRMTFLHSMHLVYWSQTRLCTVDGQSECHVNNKMKSHNANGNNKSDCVVSVCVCVFGVRQVLAHSELSQTHHHKSIRSSQKMHSPLVLAISLLFRWDAFAGTVFVVYEKSHIIRRPQVFHFGRFIQPSVPPSVVHGPASFVTHLCSH